MDLLSLPPQILISRMTYLPFKDVVSLCKTNTRLHNICMSDKYRNDWKSLIDDTYGMYPDYQELVKADTDLRYNYLLYTQLIHNLDPHIQLEIYKKQGDEEEITRVNRMLKLLERIDIARRDGRVLDVSFMSPDFTGIRMIHKPGKGSRKIGPEGLPIISSDYNRYKQVIEVLGPKYKVYLDEYIELIPPRQK